ncbi:MAG: class I SAM-dependent methyltransferase [Anaerolineae bacterium]|nr:class I SAM-dependent methyltransferase [Anaerolineae bacterium]
MEHSSDFYDVLAPLFDLMTDWEARLAGEGPFLRRMLVDHGAMRVLDAACGSGGHALALARWGYVATGADASPVMVALAERKATNAGLAVPFVVADLARLPAAFAEIVPFDAVLCLGNSLPHLLTQDDLVAALRGMAAVLRPGGLLITQNLNYDLRWRTRPRSLALQSGLMDGQEHLVWRFADYDLAAGRIAFHIAVFRRGESGWNVHTHTTPQRPLFQADLLAGLAAAGFGAARSFGKMDWPAPGFEPATSPDLVVVARKM